MISYQNCPSFTQPLHLVIDLLPQHQMRISSNVIFSQHVVLLMTIFRKIGLLWDGNTPDCSCSTNTKFLLCQMGWPQCRDIKREREKNDVGHEDSKCYHSITADSLVFFINGMRSLCHRQHHRSYWKSILNVPGDNHFSQA